MKSSNEMCMKRTQINFRLHVEGNCYLMAPNLINVNKH